VFNYLFCVCLDLVRVMMMYLQEVVAERDGFREAMQGLLVGGDTSMDGDERECPPKMTSPSRSGKSKEERAGGGSEGGASGWEGEAAWSSAAFKGVSSLLGGTAAVGATMNAAAYQTTIQGLQSEVIKLRKENEKLSELKKLKVQVEELEKNLEEAESAAKAAEKWSDEEFGVLSSKIEGVTAERDEVLVTLQQSREEVERLLMQISRTAVKYSNYEEKLTTRNTRIEALEKELKEVKDKAIDPVEFEKLKDKVQELMGESLRSVKFDYTGVVIGHAI
jgi:hypothetical protein